MQARYFMWLRLLMVCDEQAQASPMVAHWRGLEEREMFTEPRELDRYMMALTATGSLFVRFASILVLLTVFTTARPSSN